MTFSPTFSKEIHLKTRAVLKGELDRVLANPRGNQIEFDETEEFHGAGRHFSADELFLGAVLASLSNTFLYFARRRQNRFHFSELVLDGDVEVKYDESTRVYRVSTIVVKGKLVAPAEHRKMALKLWTLAAQTCHLLQSIDPQIKTKISVDYESR